MELVNNLGSLELKNQEIIDSISSASRIQEAVLPDLDKTFNEFSDFSLIWEPRDIVGGDCYWSVKFEKQIWPNPSQLGDGFYAAIIEYK